MHVKVFSIQIFQYLHQIPPRVCTLVLFIIEVIFFFCLQKEMSSLQKTQKELQDGSRKINEMMEDMENKQDGEFGGWGDGGWRAKDGWESGGWRVEGVGWRVEGGGWRVEDGGWRVEGGGWRVEGGGWWVGPDWGHVVLKLTMCQNCRCSKQLLHGRI